MKWIDIMVLTLPRGQEKVVYCHEIWKSFAVKVHYILLWQAHLIAAVDLLLSKSKSQFIYSYFIVNGPE